MTTHVMIDLETLSTRSDAAVLSVGAVKFTSDEMYAEAEKIKESVRKERSPDRKKFASYPLHNGFAHFALKDNRGYKDIETCLWWMEQSEEARRAAIDLPRLGDHRIGTMLQLFVEWVGDCPVWGNGASFDNTIFRSLCQRYSVTCWNPWQDRCYRTWKQDKPLLVSGDRIDIYHHALCDAYDQAAHMVRHGGF